jgi:hypothetical protein
MHGSAGGNNGRNIEGRTVEETSSLIIQYEEISLISDLMTNLFCYDFEVVLFL